MRLRLTALLLVATAACGTASADVPTPLPTPAAAPAPVPHPAMLTLDRLAAAEVVPGVVGASVADAQALLDDHGLAVQVVEFEPTAPVSAQYPAPGAARPGDGVVTVWTGAPPVPPPPPPPAAASALAAVDAVSEPSTAAPAPATPLPPPPVPALDDSVAPAPQPSPPPPPPSPSPSPSEMPLDPPPAGAPDVTTAAVPPRTSPRIQPPSEPGLVLEGRASWYGPGFAGRTTACGDAFDPEQLTLASRELRCGTRVRLTGQGGTTVEATVTDWGPAEWTDRRFDLSAATFAALAHPGSGVITVRAEIL